MKGRKVVLNFLLLLVSLLTLAGCRDSADERDKAVAEAEKAKGELVKVKAILEETQSERDELKEGIAEVLEELESTRSELAAAIQAQPDLQKQANELGEQGDAAIAKATETQAIVEKLRNQLREKEREIRELEEWNKELRLTIQELQSQLEQMHDQLGEVPYGEPNEQWEEEVSDENNV